MPDPAQPPLHEHVTCVAAPAVWLSPPSGRMSGGVDGLYVADRRVLSRLVLTLDGAEPEPAGAEPRGAGEARFTAAAGDLAVERVRAATRDGGTERITVRNTGAAPVTTVLAVDAATDLAPISVVRTGGGHDPEAVPLRDGIPLTAPDGYEVLLRGTTHAEPTLAPGESYTTTITVRAMQPGAGGSGAEPPAADLRPERGRERSSGEDGPEPPPAERGLDGPAAFRQEPPAGPPPWAGAPLAVRSADPNLDALVAQGVADLGALLLGDGDDLYCAAGSPWYLTLFGRDSLWTARLALPLGHELAAGTLRALARRQGVRHDPVTEEEPGKIPHELRPAHAPGLLPPVYYGTVDATALFVVTLAEAWRWGMPAAQVAALLPAAERALEWVEGHEEFLSYTGSADGLVNQGWKDSTDGVQHADGRLAAAPVALSEVQAYAYQAAALGADLLDAFGRPGGDRHRAWAAALAGRFRARFWVDGYPAIALDGHGAPVDGPASNMGHLLGTGLLTPEEEGRVADRLAELDSGYGLRTLSDRCAGYDPLSYHLGSVWPHDTAIAIAGLVRSGHGERAASLARGLVAAAPFFGHRLPELFGGQDASTAPVPYRTACRPQAWAAAASPALVTALLGLDVDVPAGRLTVTPLPGFGPLSAANLRIGTDTVTVEVDAEGHASVTGTSYAR